MAAAVPQSSDIRGRERVDEAGMTTLAQVVSRRTTTLAPFAVSVLLALATIALPPTPRDWLPVVVAIAMTLGLILAAFLVPWQRLPKWTPATIPLLYFVVIALLGHAQGGPFSGYAPLCLLPILWLSLYGTRRQLALAVGGVAALFSGPLLAGVASYPASEWRRAILGTAIAGLVGFRVQALVADGKQRGRELHLQAATLKRAEARMSEAIAHSPVGVAQAELDGTLLTVNPALCRFLGRSEGELLGRRAREFSHPDDRDGTVGALALLATGVLPSHQEEKRYLRPDGTAVCVLLSITVVRDADGAPNQLLAHFADITAQKHAEQKLRESEASLQAIARVVRELSSSTDVRAAICAATTEVTDAVAAFIFEPDGDELALTASAGIALSPTRFSLTGGEASGAVSAFLSARRIFIEDAKTNPAASTRIAHAVDAGSVLYEPILSRGKPIGVLVVMWHRQLVSLDERAIAAVGLLADEAAVALERDALLVRLNEQAREDELTSLPNRRAWEEHLPVELTRATRAGAPCSIALLDLDHFKRFNDTYGHQAGDELLQAAALAWRAELRPSDFLARYGGEEFAIVLPGCDIAEATAALNRVAAAVPRGQTCSIGVARWDGSELPHTLVERADRCLYQAKQLGRARIEAAGPRSLRSAVNP